MQVNEVVITERVILFNLNQTYRPGMSDEELYNATHCCWHVNPAKAQKADYAMAVYRRTILAVYKIDSGSWKEVKTQHTTKRWSFDGKPANHEMQRRYVGKDFVFPSQNPFTYLNCN